VSIFSRVSASSTRDGDGNSRISATDERVDGLIKSIQAHAKALAAEIGECGLSPAVLGAIARVPREKFVPRHQQTIAYADTALPIGYGQTISQPFIVAYMTELLQVGPGDRVLEIGTGSGYQAAVLAELGMEVYSVESIPELAVAAQHTLHALGYRKVSVRTGDGHRGWPEHAPYRGIVVTAVADLIPPALVTQLETGGRLVIPLGEPGGEQWLSLVEKNSEGHVRREELFPVRFVPLCRSPPRIDA
jgi:protein-L-isoaspartate(D-aspartate) O-methyltransferase